jgi:hypothetical protein
VTEYEETFCDLSVSSLHCFVLSERRRETKEKGEKDINFTNQLITSDVKEQ